jgi:stage III sporulation protein AH
MIMIIKKKVVVISALVLMLAITGYVCYIQDNEKLASSGDSDEFVPIGEARLVSTSPVGDDENNDYFKKTRINRETQRAGSIDLLNETINNSSSSPESKKQAQDKLVIISENMEKEANCEGLIIAKGYKDCIVYIGDESINVVVKNDNELTSADTAKIRDIIYEQCMNNNIKIVAVK